MKKLIKKAIYSCPSSIILMYHHLSNEPHVKNSGCMLDTDLFYKQIESIAKFDPIDSLLLKQNKNKRIITFDDGLEDLYTIAYPFLKERNIPFSAFIVTDYIGKSGYINKSQLLELSKDPLFTLGSHGISHEILTKLKKEEKQREIVDSKKILEDIVGQKVNYFSYSHGQSDCEVLRFVKQYNLAFSALSLPYNFSTDIILGKYRIPRINFQNETYEKNIDMIKKINCR